MLFAYLFVSFNFQKHVLSNNVYRNFIYNIEKSVLLEKKNTRKIHSKLHEGLEWRIFHILTSKDIDLVFSRFSRLFVQSVSKPSER